MSTAVDKLSFGVVSYPAARAARYRELGLWTHETFTSVLSELAARHGDKIALVDARARVSYTELFLRSERLARGLLGLGIGAGDAVVVQLPNCAAFVEVCFALFRIGARPVMAQPAHRSLELTHFVRRTRAIAHVICDVHARFDYRALSRELRRECPELKHTLVLGDAEELTPLSALYVDGEPIAHVVKSEDVALFQLSGGSTSVPKLIARTHQDYLYSVRQSNRVCEFTEDTVFLVALPQAHNFPLSSPGSLGALLAGGRVVFSQTSVPDEAFAWIEREQVTVTALVPSLLNSFLSAAARNKGRLSSLKLVQVGGAKLHDSVASRVEPELGARLQQVFGMAEGLVCYTRLDAPFEQVVSTQGKPMCEHDEVRIVDEEDVELAEGSVGHLLTRGPYTICGYFDAEEHNAVAFTRDGFYRTGDLVRRLADGSLVVEGRAKDQVNRGGEKIAAPEVEDQLQLHEAVESVALVGVPDAFLGERSWAFVVLRKPVTAAVLTAHLRARGLAAFKIPDRFEFVESMPKTAVGKIDKKQLRSLAAERAAPATGRTHTSPENRT